MGQGDQSKAHRIAVQTRYGYDPTKIYDASGNVVGDIANWDRAPVLFSNQAGTGNLPEGTPDTFPDAQAPQVGGTILGSVPFSTPEPRENATNRTSGANPFPDMPGAGG